MTYQLIYSSESTTPMQSDDLEELLAHARARNVAHGITGALIYAERMFLQVLEGDRSEIGSLMARIRTDLRHENVTVLRESEIPSALFGGWKMAYVSATREQMARWAGIEPADGPPDTVPSDAPEVSRTTQFARDILSLLGPDGTAPTKAS